MANDARTRPALWHPYALMPTVAGRELVLESALGVRVTDAAGNRYIDATAGLWFCHVGHGRRELAQAARDQMARLASYSIFGDYANAPALALARRLADLAPIDDAAVFLTSGGSESIETAVKLARRYWQLRGEPQRTMVVARTGAYHGMTAYSTSLGGIPANTEGYGELVRGVLHVPPNDLAAVERAFAEHGDRIAALVGEPVQGAAGVIAPTAGYWPEVQALCRAHDVLLIADEIVTGFGRVGEWFGCERYGFVPDIIACAKGLTSGYVPAGAVIAGKRLQEPFWDGDGTMFAHGFTYSGHAAAAAVALANIQIVEDEQLPARVRELEPQFARHLSPLKDHPLVADVRTEGLMGAVELAPDFLARGPGALGGVLEGLRRHGVLSRGLAGKAIHVSPPLIIEPDDIAAIARAIAQALDEAQERSA